MKKTTNEMARAGVDSTGATKPLTITFAQHGEGFSVFNSTSCAFGAQTNFVCSFCASGEFSKGSAFFGSTIVCADCLQKVHALDATHTVNLNNQHRSQSGSINARNNRAESEAAR